MRTKRAALLCSSVIAGMTAASLVVGPRLPETMVTHWNAAGQPDGTSSKGWGQFLLPLVTLGTVVALFVSPRIDPDRANVEAFRPLYNEFVVLVTAFLAVTHAVVLAVNLGYPVPITTVILAGVGLVVYFSGTLLEQAQQNWTVGIRTPWTLDDERVWERTHEVGAQLFKLSGLLAVVGAFAPQYSMALAVGPVVLSAVAVVVYSYYLYRQQDDQTGPPA